MRKNYVASDKRGSDGNHKDRDHNRGRVRRKDKGAGGCREEYPGKRERNNLMLLELAFTHMTTIDFP